MASTSEEPQGSPAILKAPTQEPRRNLRKMLEAVIVLCVLGIFLVYQLGQSNGFSSGLSMGNKTGYNIGYNEGYQKGWDAAEFTYYYVKPPQQMYGVYNLSGYLEILHWIKPYQENVFDCSEMSAHLEWKLENEGWQTIIVTGNSPFGSGKHAWLLVETSKGQYMPVESTNIRVVWWDDPHFDNYFTYEHQFETIQDSLSYSETEFDWWKKLN